MIEVVKFKITGVTPVLMNSSKGIELAGAKIKTQVFPTVEEDAESGVYRLPNKHLYLLGASFHGATIKGGCLGKRIGKSGARTLAKAGFFVSEPECPLVHSTTGKPITKYEVFVITVIVNNARIPRGRALVRDWATTLVGEVDTSVLGSDAANIILELMNYGGKIDGVGDWRPEKKGPYGRFSAELI